MKAVDTNVVVRAVIDDDPKQSSLAKAVIAAGVYISSSVFLETAWLLASRYTMSRRDVADILLEIIDTNTVEVTNEPLLRWAVTRMREGADFADMIHLIEARDATAFATFDKKLSRWAGPDAAIKVETLA